MRGWRGRLICGALLGVLLAFSAGRAGADPLIAGCCDSITSEPSYLDLVWDYYGWPSGDPYDHNLGVDASPSSSGLSRLQSYLATDDPDAVIVLSGTPDTFMGPSSSLGTFDHDETVANIAGMVIATLNDGAEPILVAPPPAFAPCAGSVDPSCSVIDDRLYDLSVALDDLAFQEDVAFVDLYALFDAHPDPGSLLFSDGIHPNHTLGDPFIADALLPELAEVFCGNGVLDPGESCDDGNNIPGDGCAATCGIVADCLDGIDNDGDGTVDFGEDFGCDSLYDPSERTTPGVIVCDDGADNDGDSLIDFPDDPGCGHPLLTVENPACNDGADNDGDNLIDFDGGFSALGYIAADPDPDCVGKPWRDSEAEPTPSPTPTATPALSLTPTPTSAASPTPPPPITPTPMPTAPPGGTPTATPSMTPTPIATAAPTPTATPTPTSAPAVELTKDQQACVNEMNKNGAKVNKAQLKDNEKCLKDYQKGKLTTSFHVCTTADRKDKVDQARDKTTVGEAKRCATLLLPPPFAYTDATTVNQHAVVEALELTFGIFGFPVQDTDLATKVSDKDKAKCQLAMLKKASKLEETIIKELNKTKRDALKRGTVDSASALESVLIIALTRVPITKVQEKLTKAEERLKKGVDKKCGDLGPPNAIFPGGCGVGDPSLADVEDCVIAATRCRACSKIEAFDGLDLPCDRLDDGAANMSCP